MSDPSEKQQRVPLVEERLDLRKQEVETGRVRLASRVEEEEFKIRETLRRSTVRVERRPVDRLSDERPQIREEEDRLVVPVYEEVIVRRWQISEEVHLVTERSEVPYEETVILHRNRVDVERD